MTFVYSMSLRLRPLLYRLADVRASGAEHLPSSGPCVIASNHLSYIDPWIVGAHVPARRVRYLIERAWFDRSPLWRVFFRAYEAIPADDAATTVDRLVLALRDNNVVALFPEGGIARDGALGRCQPGVALVAALSAAPVIPCGLRGTGELLPPGAWLPRRGQTIDIAFGEPLTFPGAPTTRPGARDVIAFVERLRVAIAQLAVVPLADVSRVDLAR
jgi:1-acyl-sn-glycerol-3-phosphate acyltransferase